MKLYLGNFFWNLDVGNFEEPMSETVILGVFPMEPSKQSRGAKHPFGERIDAIIDPKHPLVRLAVLVSWSDFDEPFGRFYEPLGLLAPRPSGTSSPTSKDTEIDSRSTSPSVASPPKHAELHAA
jgi:hypothetical protein